MKLRNYPSPHLPPCTNAHSSLSPLLCPLSLNPLTPIKPDVEYELNYEKGTVEEIVASGAGEALIGCLDD